MKNKNILVFGSTGFIGRSITKRLLQNGDKLICPVRNASRVKRNILSGDIGQIEVIEFDINNLDEIKSLIEKSDLVINLIGILYEQNNLSFELAHYLLPKKIAGYCELFKKPFLHVSSLGLSLLIFKPRVSVSIDISPLNDFKTLLGRSL